MSPIQYEMWTENSTEDSFGITLIDSGINEISKGWPIVLSEFSEDQMTIARKYSIKGEVCVEDGNNFFLNIFLFLAIKFKIQD